MSDRSLAERDAAFFVHGYTNLSENREKGSVVITRGEGVRVFDENGKAYLEAASGMWCTTLGFDEEELVEAAIHQMRKLPYYHTLASRSVSPAIELAEKLASLVPIPDARIFFAVSGSEANDFLIKFLWYYNNAIGRPKKKKVIARKNGFHGATIAATSLTGLTKNHAGFDLPLPGFLHTDDPNYYHGAEAGESPAQYATRLADSLEQMILEEGPETVMAFMAEPVTGGGGVIVPPPTYYEKIQAVLRKYDVLFLADEVITGLGRTGNYFGCETFGIQPDAMTIAKGLSSAYQPISAVVLSKEIYEGLVAGSDANGGYFAHGATYAGHPVAAAVALRALELIEERDLISHVKRVGAHFQARLESLRDHPLVGEIRCVGLMGAVEFVADKEKHRMFDPPGQLAKRLKERTEEHGVIVRVVSCGDSVAFAPPLIITEAELDEVFDRFEKALDEVTAEARAEGLVA